MEKMELDMQLKSKVISIMQPTYFPWIGYFHLINSSDIFILYNDTQLSRRSWQLRNRIKTSNGELFLSIPIKKSDSRDNLLIKNAEINYDYNDWKKKHLLSIEHSYKKSPFFEKIFPRVELFFDKSPKYLTQLTIPIIVSIVELLEIKTKIILSSDIDYEGRKEDAIISICESFNVKKYLSVRGSKDYIQPNQSKFQDKGIEIIWQDFTHPVYKQLHGNFIPFMGIIDALFNIGVDATKKLIKLE